MRNDLLHGAVFFDLQAATCRTTWMRTPPPLRTDWARSFTAVSSFCSLCRLAQMAVRQPTLFLDLVAGSIRYRSARECDTARRGSSGRTRSSSRCLARIRKGNRDRSRQGNRNHAPARPDQSDELIHRQNLVYAGLVEQQQKLSSTPPWLAASMKQCEDRLDELNSRRERRIAELERESQCAIGDIQHIGSAWVLPHPERATEALRSMVRDEEIERIAVQAAIDFEKSRGRIAESVEAAEPRF